MTYDAALEFIHGATRFGARSGLHRITELMERMGNPQNNLRIIHVAGTNGKGSTCTMTAEVLHRAGYKTGLYISPFVVDFRERMQIDGKMIGQKRLAEIVGSIAPHVAEMKHMDMEPTEFEIVTAIALTFFCQEDCDFVVLEVGLGGRFDATNVIPAPICAAICSISLDHTQYLGDTTAKIAFEKCGILKRGSAAVLYCSLPHDALQVARETCAALGITPDIPDFAEVKVICCDQTGSRFTFGGVEYAIGMTGAHQIKNALTVLGIFRQLAVRGICIPESVIQQGLKSARFGGRMEIVRATPLCIIDGAHNREAVDMLCDNLQDMFAGRKIIVIMGMVKDKEHSYCIQKVAQNCQVFLATQPNVPRALSAQECALESGSDSFFDSPTEAARAGLAMAGDGDVIIACGSLYLIGEIKKELQA